MKIANSIITDLLSKIPGEQQENNKVVEANKNDGNRTIIPAKFIPQHVENKDNNKQQQNIKTFFKPTTSTKLTTPTRNNRATQQKPKITTKQTTRTKVNKKQQDQTTIEKRKGYWIQLAAKNRIQQEEKNRTTNTTRLQSDQKTNNLSSSHVESIENKLRPPDLISKAFPKQRLRSDGVTDEKILEVSLPVSSQDSVPDSIEK